MTTVEVFNNVRDYLLDDQAVNPEPLTEAEWTDAIARRLENLRNWMTEPNHPNQHSGCSRTAAQLAALSIRLILDMNWPLYPANAPAP